MKKHLFFIVALVATAFAAHAQIDKGNQAIGLGFSSNKSTGNSYANDQSNSTNEQDNLSVSLDYSYFIKDKLAIGVFASYGNGDSKYSYQNQDLTSTDNNNFSVGFLGKQYFMFGEKFGAFAGGSLSTSISKSKSTDFTSGATLNENKFWNVGIGLQGGVAFFPFRRLSCEAGIAAVNIGYTKQELKNANDETIYDSKNSSFAVDFAKSLNNIMFTLRYHFGFKK